MKANELMDMDANMLGALAESIGLVVPDKADAQTIRDMIEAATEGQAVERPNAGPAPSLYDEPSPFTKDEPAGELSEHTAMQYIDPNPLPANTGAFMVVIGVSTSISSVGRSRVTS